MQERYLGDIHDFFKFIFLKFLSRNLEIKIGLNWYLVDPYKIGVDEVKKNDGEKRNFLSDSTIRKYDENIAEEFDKFKNKELRKINAFTQNTHLKSYINFFNEFIDVNDRENWVKRSLIHHKSESIIFLDPDNGFSFKNRGKSSLKYIFPGECKKYLSNNKVIIFTQFQSFRKNTLTHVNDILKNLNDCELKTNISVVRNRTSPNTFFFTIKPSNSELNIEEILKKYVRKFPKTELISST